MVKDDNATALIILAIIALFAVGLFVAKDAGEDAGYWRGYFEGHSEGYEEGYKEAESSEYERGWEDGYIAALEDNAEQASGKSAA